MPSRMDIRFETDERLRTSGTITGGELLARLREHGSHFTPGALDRIEEAKAADRPPEDEWRTG